MNLPLVGFLHEAGARVVAFSPPYVHRVYWGMEAIDQLIVDPDGPRRSRIIARTQWLHTLQPEAVVATPPSFSSALPGLLAGIRRRIGFRAGGRSALLTDAIVPARDRRVHLSREYVALGRRALQRVGLPVPERWSTPPIQLGEGDRAAAAALRADLGLTRPYAVIVPGATFGPAKSWPWERFREVARALSSDVDVVVAGSGSERALGERVADGLARVAVAAGRTSLGAFFALLADAGVVVANDSGSPHAAASLGAPVVVLFGSTSPEWTAPLGHRVAVVQHRVPCNPCFRRTCPTQLECFAGIHPDEVVARARAQLAAAA